MRPRRSSVVCRVALAGLLLALAPRTVRSQGGTLTQGALELLLPTGAFATTFGPRFRAGINAKYLIVGIGCSGDCGTGTTKPPTTGAIDVGVRYVLRRDSALSIGASLRNFGTPIVWRDAPQADPLARVVEVGVSVAPKLKGLPSEAGLRVNADG